MGVHICLRFVQQRGRACAAGLTRSTTALGTERSVTYDRGKTLLRALMHSSRGAGSVRLVRERHAITSATVAPPRAQVASAAETAEDIVEAAVAIICRRRR